MNDWRETNRQMWDERVPIHTRSSYYDVPGFLAGGNQLRDFEPAELGSVEGLDLIHLQCHFGLDTLSWARLGARVTGLDFSEPAVESARAIAAEAGIDATFVCSDVYSAPASLDGKQFDVVYTGLGALCWLPDIEGWAQVISKLLRPGGRLYLVEFHPVTDMFGDDDVVLERSYFQRGPLHWNDPGTYTDGDAETQHNASIEWVHTLGDVISAVAGAGLRVETLNEHDFTLFQRWPQLELVGPQRYRLPASIPQLPLMYSLLAQQA